MNKNTLTDGYKESIISKGGTAYFADIDRDENPYDADTPESELWDQGWLEAELEDWA